MSWLAVALGALATAAAGLWLGERTRRRRGEAAALRRESTSAEVARAARDDAESRLRGLFECAEVGMLQLDAAFAVVDANDALCRLLGTARPALLRVPFPTLLHPDDREAAQVAFGALVRGERVREDAARRLLRADGGVRQVRLALSTLVDEAGAFRSAIGLVEDVTEPAELAARLARAERLASLGAVAAGLAHELNEPLACVVGNLAMAREALAGGPAATPEATAQVRQALDEAHLAAARAGKLVGDLQALSRPSSARPEPVDVPAALRTALSLVQGTLERRAQVELALAPVEPVLGDPARLGRAFLALLAHGVQAIPEGRREVHRLRLATSSEADGRIKIEFADSGSGIAPEVLPRLLSPPGGAAHAEAAGLGLDVCRRTIEGMGGELLARSAPGHGTTFTILLPPAPVIHRRSPAVPTPPAAPTGAMGPPGRVLVVDDEPYVGRILRRILGQAHEVEVVTSGPAALARLAAGPPPDVILCDLMMPGMSGMELFAELTARAPAAASRVVFVTGGALHEPARRFLAEVRNPVLEKPFTPDLLRRVVAESVARGVASIPSDLAGPAI